ncbi:MAG: hypothetical protein AMXMBFR74_02760 [Parvibaculum sp.]|uniref:DUF6456 domain-containing protein n=1 Tax=Parvibaculum sp. TaxID=2024848 RepID=UPI0035B6EA20
MTAARTMRPAERRFEREVRRIFRLLAQPGYLAGEMVDGRVGLFGPGGGKRPLATLEASVWSECEARDLVEPVEGEARRRWRANDAGRALYRRLIAEAEPFRAQHQLVGERRFRTEEGEVSLAVNEAETPLGWLRRRKGADGKPLISDRQFEAGEKLRTDFTLGQMSPRVTMDWAGTGGRSGTRRGPLRDPAEIANHALAARERVGRAIEAAGPHLGDILLSVCCHLEGLEAAERGFGWPKRSGKLVLQIALDRLAEHYGIKE